MVCSRTVAMVAVGLMVSSGCSLFWSSSRSSDSSSTSSRSVSDLISSSSPRGTDTKAYQNDVRDYTSAYLLSGGEFDAFQKGLGDLAARHGISNWEESEATYVGIGAGLGKAKASEVTLRTFKQNLARGDDDKGAAIQRGYDSIMKAR
jgi:hypothetical protein